MKTRVGIINELPLLRKNNCFSRILPKSLKNHSKIMKYFSIAITQRQKEFTTSNLFVIYALISSLALHIPILIIGFNSIIDKNFSEIDEQPIELVTLEKTYDENLKLPEKIVSKQQLNNNTTNQNKTPLQSPSPVLSIDVSNQVKTEVNIPDIKQKSTPIAKTSVQKIPNKVSRTKITAATPVKTNSPTSSASKQSVLEKIGTTIPNENTQTDSNNQEQSEIVQTQNNQIHPPLEEENTTQEPTENIPPTLSTEENQQQQENTNTPTLTSSPVSDGQLQLNLVECSECLINYPQTALVKRIEGHTEVIVDYNDQGKVINYSLKNSSGSEELNLAVLEQIRKFKFKPLIGGKSALKVRINFAISGTQYHRTLKEKQRKREQKRLQREKENKPLETNKLEIDIIINS